MSILNIQVHIFDLSDHSQQTLDFTLPHTCDSIDLVGKRRDCAENLAGVNLATRAFAHPPKTSKSSLE